MTPLFSLVTDASHDVAVGPDGSVYATHFQNNTGVLKFSPNLTTFTKFVNPGDHGLKQPSGMVVDASGNLWVSNIGTGTGAFVNEYDSSGTFLRSVATNDKPIGLALGPGDGNIYVAEFGSNTIGKIEGGVRTTFIDRPNAGISPKYLEFTENCIAAVPELETLPLFLTGLSFLASLSVRRTRRLTRL